MTLRLFQSTAFRFSVVSALVLTAALLVLGSLSFLYVQHSMRQELRHRIEQEVEVLIQAYRDDGLEELFHDIGERRDINKRNRLLYFFESTKGSGTFDAIPTFPSSFGWHEAVLPEPKIKVLLYSLPLSEDHSLAVGGSLDGLDRVEKILIRTLILAVCLTLIIGALAGVYLSRRFLARIDQVSRAAERIGDGNLHERIVTDGSGDDFDQLIGTINKMLERIELLMKSVKRVSANVAHELRTPLGHLQQDIMKLEEFGVPNEEGRELMRKAKTEIDRVLEIFAALLRISELESGELKSRFAVLNISEILQELADTYGPVAEEHRQKVVLHPPDASLRCKGDRRLLVQLFSNIIENSIRHGGEFVTIEIIVEDKNSISRVVISDDGVGMTPECIQAAERKLADLDPGKASDFSRGIELILVGAIARLHEFKLQLRSNAPGLRVMIEFPTMN
ncbi:MAG: HAMP domain-containing histidine kinase [Bdellovibrionales bacterium]|nr:HAMP domain-containing histidine kinase [Bdellovibrionales bacterium]